MGAESATMTGFCGNTNINQNEEEILCIETRKVYDFCFAQEHRTECFLVPEECVPVPPDAQITCEITGKRCREVRRIPIPGQPEGVVDVLLAIEVDVVVTIEDCPTPITETVDFTLEVPVCAPEGTQIQCEIPTADCRDVIVIDEENRVCVSLDICILIQSKATVKLLVPTFGFCQPRPCELPKVIICPPEQLFPPQCPPPVDTEG